MTTVYRITAIWSGFQGAPGYSKFSFQNLIDDSSRNAAGVQVKNFFDGIISLMQSSWNIAVQSSIDEFDMATGALTGGSAMTTVPAPSVGTGAATLTYQGGAGACVTWTTPVVFNGRRVRGRTFLVPLVNAAASDGTLAATALSAINSAALAFANAAGPEFSIWARQFSPTNPNLQIGGALAPVTGGSSKDMTAQLRSRRL
jgi:hypothetical protein